MAQNCSICHQDPEKNDRILINQHASFNASELKNLRCTVQNKAEVNNSNLPLQVSWDNPLEICAIVHAVSGVPSKPLFNNEIKVNTQSEEERVLKYEEEPQRTIILSRSPTDNEKRSIHRSVSQDRRRCLCSRSRNHCTCPPNNYHNTKSQSEESIFNHKEEPQRTVRFIRSPSHNEQKSRHGSLCSSSTNHCICSPNNYHNIKRYCHYCGTSQSTSPDRPHRSRSRSLSPSIHCRR